MTARILDMTPIPHDPRGYGRRWRFHTSLPDANVRMTGKVCATPDEAQAIGAAEIRAYEQRDPFGNMGEVCGVAAVDGGYRAVINTYHSNS